MYTVCLYMKRLHTATFWLICTSTLRPDVILLQVVTASLREGFLFLEERQGDLPAVTQRGRGPGSLHPGWSALQRGPPRVCPGGRGGSPTETPLEASDLGHTLPPPTLMDLCTAKGATHTKAQGRSKSHPFASLNLSFLTCKIGMFTPVLPLHGAGQ